MFWFVLRRNWWKITKTLLLGGTLLFAGFCGYVFFALTNNVYNDWWFDEAIWKNQPKTTSDRDNRMYMSEDLQQRILKKGMTRQQIRALLGRPDAQDFAQNKKSLYYHLGSDWHLVLLEIEFDKHDKMLSSSLFTPPD